MTDDFIPASVLLARALKEKLLKRDAEQLGDAFGEFADDFNECRDMCLQYEDGETTRADLAEYLIQVLSQVEDFLGARPDQDSSASPANGAEKEATTTDVDG